MTRPKTYKEFQQLLMDGKKFIVRDTPKTKVVMHLVPIKTDPGLGGGYRVPRLFSLYIDGFSEPACLVVIQESGIKKITWGYAGSVAKDQDLFFVEIEFLD